VRSLSFDRIRTYVAANPDLLALVLITALAAFLRLWALDSIPAGIHGDEAWTGLDAHRVQAEGWIGPYVSSAYGQPSGPLYWAAAVLGVLGDSVFTLRFSMALLGIATVPALYFAGRMMFDRPTALIAAALLMLLNWHLHYSRLGFMVISWPLAESLVLGLLFLALKRGSDLRLWALAGSILGLGIYTYNVYPLFVLVLALFAAVQLALAGQERLTVLKRLVLFFACSALTALPMLLYIAKPEHDYLAHHRQFSVFSSEAYKQADTTGKVDILERKTNFWLGQLMWHAHPDGADGAGLKPMLDKLTLALILGGSLISLLKIRQGPSQVLLLMLLLIPLAAIFSIDGGFRRTLGLTPALALLAALPLAALWRLGQREGRGALVAASAIAIAAVVIAFGFLNVRAYFHTGTSDLDNNVFAASFTSAVLYIKDRPGHPHVYVFSENFPWDHETRRYLAPDIVGENRSKQFSENQSIEAEPGQPALFLLMSDYLERLPEIQARYPGGETFTKRNKDQVWYITYSVRPQN
jgi:4-amino-4-deoxy-L-arabinose transferase-like glycosyltransferase